MHLISFVSIETKRQVILYFVYEARYRDAYRILMTYIRYKHKK
jgi:hypothetical protein